MSALPLARPFPSRTSEVRIPATVWPPDPCGPGRQPPGSSPPRAQQFGPCRRDLLLHLEPGDARLDCPEAFPRSRGNPLGMIPLAGLVLAMRPGLPARKNARPAADPELFRTSSPLHKTEKSADCHVILVFRLTVIANYLMRLPWGCPYVRRCRHNGPRRPAARVSADRRRSGRCGSEDDGAGWLALGRIEIGFNIAIIPMIGPQSPDGFFLRHPSLRRRSPSAYYGCRTVCA